MREKTGTVGQSVATAAMLTVKLDSRTKMYLLLLANAAVFLSPSLEYELLFMALIFLLYLWMGMYSLLFKILLSYSFVMAVQLLSERFLPGVWQLMFVSFAMFIRKIYPCIALGSLLIGTTKMNEFMTALTRIGLSKKIIIPFAVMLRYFPVIGEDWRYIKDAMKLRGITPSMLGFIRRPLMTVECIYVPLMMAASKIADELAVASITRGIENPKQRTCYERVSFQFSDVLAAIVFTSYVAAGVWI